MKNDDQDTGAPALRASAPIAGANHIERLEDEHEELLFFVAWAHAKLNPAALTTEERDRMDRINGIIMRGGV